MISDHRNNSVSQQTVVVEYHFIPLPKKAGTETSVAEENLYKVQASLPLRPTPKTLILTTTKISTLTHTQPLVPQSPAKENEVKEQKSIDW